MKVLAIDTSGTALGAAIASDAAGAGILGSFSLNTSKNHSLALLPMLEALLQNLQLTLADLDGFAVTVGPGSFTGLRIGMATVKAWAQSLEKPLLAVSSTEAMARAASLEGYVCPIFDARRNEVYSALFCDGARVWPDLALTPAALAEKLQALDAPLLLAGDGLPSYGAELAALLPGRLRTLPAERSYNMAESAAMLGLAKLQAGQVENLATLTPVYLRLSEAEEKRLAAAAEQAGTP